MHRREVIKKVLIVGGGISLFWSCNLADEQPGADDTLFTGEDEELMSGLAEAILPATDTPGAAALELHLFAMKMVSDCYPPADNEKFREGLRACHTAAVVLYKKKFPDCSPSEKQEFVQKMETEELGEAVGHFYKTTKQLVIQGYLSSEYVMTKLNVYELVPGRFSGYHPVAS